MKRLLAALLGVVILLLPLLASAEADDANPFLFGDEDTGDVEFDIDPFSDFAEAFEVDPYMSNLGDDDIDEELFAYAFGEGNAFDGSHSGDADQSPDATPAPPISGGSGSLQATINGEQLVLSFDSSPAYSNISNNMAQAAFYTYGDSTGYLYEMFLVFPYDSKGGDTITPEYAMQNAVDTSVMLLISSTESDQYYIASQLNNSTFPRTSTYSIHFDSVTVGADTTQYVGSVSAKMVSYNIASGDIGESVEIEGATFSFSISNAGSDRQQGDGSEEPNPFLDETTPAPTTTLPPDYRKV